MGTAIGMIKVGRSLIGTRERPMGSNHAPPVTTEYGVTGAWCDMSITYEAKHSDNLAAVGGRFAYCPAHTRWFYNRGRWKYGAGDLKPGDVVFFEWGGRRTLDADHVGLVEKVFADGSFYCLEGNTGDQFKRVHRDSTYVAGRGRPDYASEDDVQLGDKVKLGGWVKATWPKDKGITDGSIAVNTALGSGYAHARAAHEGVDELRRMVAAQNVVLDKLVSAVSAPAPDIAALRQEIKDELARITVRLDVAPGEEG